MEYNIYNYFDKDDSLGVEIQININGYRFKVGKNVVINKDICVFGDSSKETYIGHDTYIGKGATIEAGSIIAARNILLEKAKVRGETKYESVIDGNGNVLTFDAFIKTIISCNTILKDKINIAFVADDYGRNSDANAGVEYYLANNILNHASLMINRGTSTEDAIRFIKNNKIEKSIGLHFNITEVPDKYSVNIKGNFGQIINSSKRANFILKKSEKQLVLNELNHQINKFKENLKYLNYFDSHGHIHLKPSICQTILPTLKFYNFEYVRIPRYNMDNKSIKHRAYDCLFKNRVYRKYSHNFKHFDFFLMSKEIFKLSNDGLGKTFEVMTHPYHANNSFINRRDIDFTCLLGFLVDHKNIFNILIHD